MFGSGKIICKQSKEETVLNITYWAGECDELADIRTTTVLARESMPSKRTYGVGQPV
jgi:hypothetical protein